MHVEKRACRTWMTASSVASCCYGDASSVRTRDSLSVSPPPLPLSPSSSLSLASRATVLLSDAYCSLFSFSLSLPADSSRLFLSLSLSQPCRKNSSSLAAAFLHLSRRCITGMLRAILMIQEPKDIAAEKVSGIHPRPFGGTSVRQTVAMSVKKQRVRNP